MEELIQLIEKLDDRISNTGLYVTIIVILFFIYTTKSGWIKVVESLQLTKFSINIGFGSIVNYIARKKIKKLYNHPVFARLEYAKGNDHIFFTHGEVDEAKTKAFQDFLKVKMDSTKKYMTIILNKASAKAHDEIELRNLIATEFNYCNCNLEFKMIEKYKAAGLSTKDAEVLMSKFLKLRKIALDNYGQTFDNVFADPAFNTNYLYLSVVYHLVHNEILEIVNTSIKVFEDINGAFIQTEYATKR